MSRTISICAVLLAAFILVTSIYGGYHFYSPIPYWDQWDGQIGFYRRLGEHPFAAIWGQHMEHRIVFSRLLFWIDRVAFDGGNALLVIVNYLIAAGTAAVFVSEYIRNKDRRVPAVFVFGLVSGMLFLWTQENNLDWGFQSGSLGVNLFTVWAFARFSRDDGRTRNIIAAILLLLAATLTMGNGVVGFAVLLGQAFLQRRMFKEYLIVGICGLLVAAAYYYNFSKPVLDPDPAVTGLFLVQPKFFAMFLGSPLFFVSGSLKFAAIAGLLSLAVFGAFSLYVFAKDKVTPYRAFLIATYVFIVISAIGAAHSRWMLGLAGAVASRYTTPALVGFTAGILLILDVVRGRWLYVTSIAALVLLTALASHQTAVTDSAQDLYLRKLAVLSQKIGMDRPDYDQFVYPRAMHDRYVENATFAAEHKIGAYGKGWLHDAGMIKFDPDRTDSASCEGHLEATSGPSGNIAVSGWAAIGSAADLLIVIVDSADKTVGYGVTGYERRDVAEAVKGAPRDAGWMGFANVAKGPISAYVYRDGKFCKLS
ncbi:hypothetical protein [Paraburkholderia fungorum]|uniref:hypothetical protein n=1 Tax=Paraburkholderia fungorum TaxID=134537 RepID=UPI00248D630D|nr:hypothetical protein [Paraburkholderia fungorum]